MKMYKAQIKAKEAVITVVKVVIYSVIAHVVNPVNHAINARRWDIWRAIAHKKRVTMSVHVTTVVNQDIFLVIAQNRVLTVKRNATNVKNPVIWHVIALKHNLPKNATIAVKLVIFQQTVKQLALKSIHDRIESNPASYIDKFEELKKKAKCKY